MILYGTNPIAWSNDDDQTIGAHLSLEDCLSDCRKIGFDGIEKGHKMPNEGTALKDTGLTALKSGARDAGLDTATVKTTA